MSLDLLAMEIAREWHQSPGWLYDMPRSQLERMIGWWRATKCDYQPPVCRASKTVRGTNRGQSFWLGGD
jgi:hypothetical protein